MSMNHESSPPPRWIVFGTALVYFALGSLLTAHFMHLKEGWADNHRVFQLKIHRAVPGKVPALDDRLLSDSRLQASGLDVVEYWVPGAAPALANKFVCLVAHASREEAKTHRDAFYSDSAFQEYVQSEMAEQLIQGAHATFVRLTDDLSMK